MSTMSAARRLLAALPGRAIDGRRSLVWVALTCTSWCSWQNYNLPTFNRIDDDRAYSVKMIHVLTWVINQVQKSEDVRGL
eukprot:9508506-Heterocapsa_arctica.AAC.1